MRVAEHGEPANPTKLASTLERVIFGYRRTILILFALVTIVMLFVAVRGLRIDASFTKQLPLKHEYMQTFVKHQARVRRREPRVDRAHRERRQHVHSRRSSMRSSSPPTKCW